MLHPDACDVLLYSDLALIGAGLWLQFELGLALTPIGVMLFSVGVWTSMKWGKYRITKKKEDSNRTISDHPRAPSSTPAPL